jgi:recombinase
MREVRDQIQSPVSLDYFQQRAAAGWKLKAIEWERADDQATVPELGSTPSPYGLELVPETARLQQSPEEAEVLLTILELIVVEKGVSHIASELNRRGYATRGGKPWTSSAVFNLLPLLIEAAPDILKSEDWHTHRLKLKSNEQSARQ